MVTKMWKADVSMCLCVSLLRLNVILQSVVEEISVPHMTPCAVHMALSVTARFRCLLYNVFELRTAGRYEMLSVVET